MTRIKSVVHLARNAALHVMQSRSLIDTWMFQLHSLHSPPLPLLPLDRRRSLRPLGKVLDPPSMLTVRKIEHVKTGTNNKPRLAVVVQESGEL